jgi:hypothetical protein
MEAAPSASRLVAPRHQSPIADLVFDLFRLPKADRELAAVTYRVPLPATVEERSGITSNTGLLAYAFAKVALEDHVGLKILCH